jgi:hypothetical protein
MDTLMIMLAIILIIVVAYVIITFAGYEIRVQKRTAPVMSRKHMERTVRDAIAYLCGHKITDSMTDTLSEDSKLFATALNNVIDSDKFICPEALKKLHSAGSETTGGGDAFVNKVKALRAKYLKDGLQYNIDADAYEDLRSYYDSKPEKPFTVRLDDETVELLINNQIRAIDERIANTGAELIVSVLEANKEKLTAAKDNIKTDINTPEFQSLIQELNTTVQQNYARESGKPRELSNTRIAEERNKYASDLHPKMDLSGDETTEINNLIVPLPTVDTIEEGLDQIKMLIDVSKTPIGSDSRDRLLKKVQIVEYTDDAHRKLENIMRSKANTAKDALREELSESFSSSDEGDRVKVYKKVAKAVYERLKDRGWDKPDAHMIGTDSYGDFMSLRKNFEASLASEIASALDLYSMESVDPDSRSKLETYINTTYNWEGDNRVRVYAVKKQFEEERDRILQKIVKTSSEANMCPILIDLVKNKPKEYNTLLLYATASGSPLISVMKDMLDNDKRAGYIERNFCTLRGKPISWDEVSVPGVDLESSAPELAQARTLGTLVDTGISSEPPPPSGGPPPPPPPPSGGPPPAKSKTSKSSKEELAEKAAKMHGDTAKSTESTEGDAEDDIESTKDYGSEISNKLNELLTATTREAEQQREAISAKIADSAEEKIIEKGQRPTDLNTNLKTFYSIHNAPPDLTVRDYNTPTEIISGYLDYKESTPRYTSLVTVNDIWVA